MNTVTIVSNCARVFVAFEWEGNVDYDNHEQGIINVEWSFYFHSLTPKQTNTSTEARKAIGHRHYLPSTANKLVFGFEYVT